MVHQWLFVQVCILHVHILYIVSPKGNCLNINLSFILQYALLMFLLYKFGQHLTLQVPTLQSYKILTKASPQLHLYWHPRGRTCPTYSENLQFLINLYSRDGVLYFSSNGFHENSPNTSVDKQKTRTTWAVTVYLNIHLLSYIIFYYNLSPYKLRDTCFHLPL